MNPGDDNKVIGLDGNTTDEFDVPPELGIALQPHTSATGFKRIFDFCSVHALKYADDPTRIGNVSTGNACWS